MTESAVERVAVVAIAGVIDRETCSRLRSFLRRKLARRTRGVVIDLELVTRMDACGIATLIDYQRSARAFGGELVLVGLCPRVLAVLEMMGVEEIFLLKQDVAAGVAAVGWGREPEARARGWARGIWAGAIWQRVIGRLGVLGSV
jgi:anti-anti-sigma factor